MSMESSESSWKTFSCRASIRPKPRPFPAPASLVAVFFLAWFALVFGLGNARRLRRARQERRPSALLIGLVGPVSLFLLGYWTIPALREFILSADLRLIVGIQAWRWAGFGFLTLYTYRILPGIFAWPAGLGDMAIGFTAPLVLSRLLHRPNFAASKSFVAWNLGGILDLDRSREYRGDRSAARSQSFRGNGFAGSNVASAARAGSGLPGSGIFDAASYGVVSGTSAEQITARSEP